MEAIRFDSKKCIGCHSCAFACAVEHSQSKDPLAAHLEDTKPINRRYVRLVKGKNRAVACVHCKKPACVEACEPGAMQKGDDGLVICDASKCTGCWECIEACPFDAVKPGNGSPIKCDMCPDREDSYACVEACPTGALYVVALKGDEAR